MAAWANRLATIIGIDRTLNLGKYLGIPLLHSRVSKAHFNDLIEKVQGRLTGWSNHTLNGAGRATLIQSVSSTIPSYTMQTMEIPISVCEKLDKINRNFLWGDSNKKKKIHLLSWSKVCKSKDSGGLGIRKARHQNLALLAKLGWKITTKENSLWVSFLRDKYLHNNSLLSWSWPCKKSASFVWRSITKANFIIKKGVKWKIGDGNSIDLWLDWWFGDGPLIDKFPGNHGSHNVKLNSIFNTNNGWDLSSISQVINTQTVAEILLVNIPDIHGTGDHPTWVATPNGTFSSAAAFNIVNPRVSNSADWKWIWKLNIPAKLQFFLWLTFHDVLPTNSLRACRGMIAMSFCPRCDETPEDTNHLFRGWLFRVHLCFFSATEEDELLSTSTVQYRSTVNWYMVDLFAMVDGSRMKN
ncbi:hypothetical protein RHMOL_Rhmol01G0297000 [Rhododendron molle]|uniref:Uncharacterized protein n=1 Tax=Rhododendron molle TaxID=49168 RepID=A0ACC0Q8Z2_RHOML|nr:hypothetical protein RHMOL_Rhmol01G0297000 [Rhododendron molle]